MILTFVTIADFGEAKSGFAELNHGFATMDLILPLTMFGVGLKRKFGPANSS
jgi:hypothetical protein